MVTKQARNSSVTMNKRNEQKSVAIPCAECGLPSMEISPDGEWVSVVNRHHGGRHPNRFPADWLIARILELKQSLESAAKTAR